MPLHAKNPSLWHFSPHRAQSMDQSVSLCADVENHGGLQPSDQRIYNAASM